MEIGNIVNLYENSEIAYTTPNSGSGSNDKTISFRSAFFLNAYFLSNASK